MGQKYLGAAVLHDLEGYAVFPIDLDTLLADSGRVSLNTEIAVISHRACIRHPRQHSFRYLQKPEETNLPSSTSLPWKLGYSV